MQISKFWFAVALVATATFGAGIATATHVFNDVEDGRFYAEPAEWAADNGITNGCGSGNFCPDDPVTRGENITFAKRYDDNIVQPALADLDSTIEELEMEIEELQAVTFSQPSIRYARIEGIDSATIALQSGLLSASRVAEGTYNLTWDRDVSDCVATGTDIIWSETNDVSVEAGVSTPIAEEALTNTGVTIRDDDGLLNDSWFYVTVVCPPETLFLTGDDAPPPASPNRP